MEGRSALDDPAGTETAEGMAQNDEEDADAACVVDRGDSGGPRSPQRRSFNGPLAVTVRPMAVQRLSWTIMLDQWPHGKSAGAGSQGRGHNPAPTPPLSSIQRVLRVKSAAALLTDRTQ